MSTYEQKFGGSEAYRKYQSIKNKFTKEFNHLTFNLMVEVYAREQMGRSILSDRDFVKLKNTWESVAAELDVLRSYPYDIKNSYPPAHPYAKDVSIEAKLLLGVAV